MGSIEATEAVHDTMIDMQVKRLVNSVMPGFNQENGEPSPAGSDPHAREIWKSRAPLDRPDRRKAGIFYADIANYARLTEQDEEGTHMLLVEAITIMMTNVADNRGRIAHLAGDAILAEFENADSALHCAIRVQQAARLWNADRAAEQQVLFRIGVNFGEVISDRGDIHGNAVNLAARLERLASSGGICVSESVWRELDGNPDYRFVDIGNQCVSNIHQPVHAFWIEIDPVDVVDSELTTAVRISAVSS